MPGKFQNRNFSGIKNKMHLYKFFVRSGTTRFCNEIVINRVAPPHCHNTHKTALQMPAVRL